VVVTGSGILDGATHTHSVPVTFIVTAPPDFSLAASPSTLTIGRSSSGSYTVMINRTGGFSPWVYLSASGLPNGVTATFNPTAPPAGVPSTLTVSAAQSAKVGTFPLTISGTGGGLTRTTSVTLVIVNK